MSTPVWPASWNARMRCSGMPLPRVMCGAVTSMPSLTRSGRPSSSFFSSSPLGSTSTAFRVSSATPMAASLLPRRGRPRGRSPRGLCAASPSRRRVEILYLDRLEFVGRLKARDPSEEREVSLARALDVLRLAKAVGLACQGDIRVRDAAALQGVHDHLGLGRRHDLVVQTLQEEERVRDRVGVLDGRAVAIQVDRIGPGADEVLVVMRFELVCLIVERDEICNAE